MRRAVRRGLDTRHWRRNHDTTHARNQLLSRFARDKPRECSARKAYTVQPADRKGQPTSPDRKFGYTPWDFRVRLQTQLERIYCFFKTAELFSLDRMADSRSRKEAALADGISMSRTTYSLS